MKYLMIQNQGEIDIMALVLMGASTKRDEPGKIGWFGSGNKYSIATLMRMQIPFRIFSGETEIFVKSEPYHMGGKDFDKIYFEMGGKRLDTSLTIQMGPDWEPWYVVREIYCNALDEGHAVVVPMTADISGSAGNTRFYIGVTKEIEPVISNWNGYFSHDRLDLLEQIPGVKIFLPKGDGLRVYRRGVLVHHDPVLPSIFDYDVDDAPINESRTLRDQWTFRYLFQKKLSSGATVDIAKRLLVGMHNYEHKHKSCFEAELDLKPGMHDNKENWLEAVRGFVFINRSMAGRYTEEQKSDSALLLRGELINSLVETVDDTIERYGVPKAGMRHAIEEYKATEDELVMVNTAIQYLRKAGFEKEYPIEIVKFSNHSNKGATDGTTIYVGKSALDLGVRFVALVLLEEIGHIESGQSDETRGFQWYLLERWMLGIEKQMGYTL